MARPLIALTAALAVALPTWLAAWGGAGHHVVVQIALSRMTPEARQFVRGLLGDEDPVEASTWADRVRSDRSETYNWHFVNAPFGATFDPTRDCRPTEQGDCVIAAIERARAEIVDGRRPRAARAESLKFLLHFVGDMHQPLHNAGKVDRGGNDVATVVQGYEPEEGRRQPNLHSVWDGVLIGQRRLGDRAYADLLIGRLTSEPLADSEAIDVVAWSNEAHALAERYVYAYPGFSPIGPPGEPAFLDATYQRVGQAVIDRQLMRAGVRLARILNAAAGDQAPGIRHRA